MKLRSKERQGSKVKKRHDEPKAPCRRLLESGSLGEEEKNRLRQTYEELNVVKLKGGIDSLQRKVWRLQEKKKKCPNYRVDSYVR